MLKQRTSCKNQDLWLTSYADLVTAILAVLVLMVSFSKIDIEKYDMIQRLMVEKKEQNFSDFSTLREIKERIEKKAQQANLKDKILVKLDSNGLTISFDSTAQFKTSEYRLKKDAFKIMKPIFIEIIKESKYRYIDIAGFTDDVPGSKMTNWELSALRALAIQKKLEKYGLNNNNVRLLANSKNKPLVKYINKKGINLKKARAKNRRVSITIRDAKFNDLERK